MLQLIFFIRFIKIIRKLRNITYKLWNLIHIINVNLKDNLFLYSLNCFFLIDIVENYQHMLDNMGEDVKYIFKYYIILYYNKNDLYTARCYSKFYKLSKK